MSRTERQVVQLLAAVYVVCWLACIGATELELLDDDGDVGSRWRSWGSA